MTTVLFFGHSLITRRQWSFVKTLDEETPLNVIYYPPSTWGKHTFQGSGKVHEVTPTNAQGGIWSYYYEPEYIFEQIDRYKPDWIGGFVEPYSTAGAIMQKVADEAGVKTFFFAYENVVNNFFDYPPLIKSFFPIIEKADLILCGNTQAQKFMDTLGAQKTVLVPHTGIEEDFFNIMPDVRKTFAGIFLGRDVPEKGWELIQKALNNMTGMTKAFRPAYFIPEEEIPEFYNKGKLFIHASLRTRTWMEQLGYVIAEALGCGLNVMMSKYGSQVEWFKDAPGVIIYDPLDPESINSAFNVMMKKPSPNVEGRKWIEENFSNKVVADKYYDLLRSD